MSQRLLVFAILIFVAASVDVYAQRTGISKSNANDASKQNSYDRNNNEPELSESMIETRHRWKVREEEKEHKEMVERGESAARLGEELKKSFADNNRLLANDAAKLDELEKLLKKIRKNMGGDDDDTVSEAKPATLADALAKLAENGVVLQEELKTSTRYEISASAIEKANEMLELIALIRTFSR